MNILYLTNTFPSENNPVNGHYLFSRYLELLKLGHNVEVVVVNHIRERKRSSYSFEYNGVSLKVHVVNYLQIPKTTIQLGLFLPLLKIVKSKHIDILHVHHINQGNGAWLLNSVLGVPYVTTAHGSDIHTKLKDKKHFTISKRVLEKSSCNIFVSNVLLNIAKESGIVLGKTAIVYNGIDIQEKVQKIDNKTKTIIFVGNLVDVKRAQCLPDIFNLIHQSHPEVKFLIVGDGPLREHIKSKISEYSLERVVELTGQLEHNDVIKKLKESYLLLLPSLNEGFGCVVLEAQSCGCQTVVSSNGGLIEAVGDVGSVVVDGDNWIRDFADTCIQLLDKPVQQDFIYDRVKEFSWNNIINQEISLYKEVLSGK